MSLVLGAFIVSACTVSVLDFTGKACPCVEGWVCDRSTNTCQYPTDGGTALTDGELTDTNAPPPKDGGPTPRIVPSELSVSWTTGTTVAWTWNASGDPADFNHWELVTGPTEADVSSRSLNTRTFTAKELPDLTSFDRVDRRSTDRIPRFFAVTYDHGRGQNVFGQIVAVDRFGNHASTNIVSGQTVATTRELTIFSEAVMQGSSSDGFARDTDRPRTGNFAYGSRVVCDPGLTTCRAILRQNLRSPPGVGNGLIMPGFDAAAFSRAYFQIAIAGNANVLPLYSTQVSVFFCPGAFGPSCLYRMPGFFFLGDTIYRVVEAPLRELRDANDAALTFQDVSAVSFELAGIDLQGIWRAGVKVRVDDISIRY